MRNIGPTLIDVGRQAFRIRRCSESSGTVRSRFRMATCSKILIRVKALAPICLQDKIKHLILKLNNLYLK